MLRLQVSLCELDSLDPLTFASEDFSFLKLFAVSMINKVDSESSQTQLSQPYTPIIEQTIPLTPETRDGLHLFLSPDTPRPGLNSCGHKPGPTNQKSSLSTISTPPTPSQVSFVPYASPSKFRRLQMTPSTPFTLDTYPPFPIFLFLYILSHIIFPHFPLHHPG